MYKSKKRNIPSFFLPVLVCIFPYISGSAQTSCLKTFQVAFGGASDEIAYDLADAGNGQFFVAGTTTSFGAGGTDILVSKMTAAGSILWSNAYGAALDETVRKITATPDGGLLVIGQTASFTWAQGEMFCFKIDGNGQLIWSRRFGLGTQYGELGMDILQTTDGGFALTGIIDVAGFVADMSVIRLDVNANILWSQRFDTHVGEDGVGILQRGDTLVVSGDVENKSGSFNATITSLSLSNGTIISAKEIIPNTRGLFNSYIFSDLQSNGYYISAHIIDGSSYAQMQPVIFKLDNSFNISKTYSYVVNGVYTNDYYTGFAQTSNGFVACASSSISPTSGYLFNINTDGSVKWSKKFTGNQDRSLYRLQQVGSNIVAVGRDDGGGQANDFFVAGFNDGGFIDSLCHPDTAVVAITGPGFTEPNFVWLSVKNQAFGDISAPITVTSVSLIPRSTCDACPVPPVVPAFSIPDTVCVNAPVNITNTSTGATTYYWNFCTADINQPPIGTNEGNPDGMFNTPVYLDYVLVNGNYYGFATNNDPDGLLRLNFGSSLLNTPTVTNLGTLNGIIPNNTEGVQIVQNGGNWYVLVVGGTETDGVTPSLVTVNLGADITNNSPTGTNWGNIGNMAYPHDLYVFQDSGHWYGITVNSQNSTITRFDFTTNLANTPTAVNLGDIGNLAGPTGTCAVKDNNGMWHVFVTNANSSTLSRLDFGNSLLNTPTAVNLGNINGTFSTCWDIYVINYCGNSIAYVINAGNNTLVKLDFNGGLLNTPTGTNFGNIGNLNFPHSLSKMFRVGANVFTFITNVNNNTLASLEFEGCTNSSVPNSAAQNPPPVSYPSPGVYNISLDIDDGLATQNSVCHQVVVVGYPAVALTGDTAVCQGTAVNLTASGGTTYQWSPPTGLSNTSGPTVTATPSTATQYFVTVNNSTGCASKDSVTVNVLPVPPLVVSANSSICSGNSVVLNASGATSYGWSPATGLSDTSGSAVIAKPAVTITYYITGSNGGVCSAKDSVTIQVFPLPVFGITPSQATICVGDSLLITATGGDVYQWYPAAGVTNPDSASSQVSPATNTVYEVYIFNSACKIADTLQASISVASLPTAAIGKSNDVDCIVGQATLTASGGSQYVWSPTATLNNPYSSNPVASPLQTTTYYVTVTNPAGCAATDSIQVKVLTDVQNGYYLANAFTPNGDNVNDCFGVKLWGGIISIDFSVYNRWGQRVFHSNSPSGCWDGTFNGQPQPPGTFVYQIQANTICGPVYRKGTVVLIR